MTDALILALTIALGASTYLALTPATQRRADLTRALAALARSLR